MDRIELINFLIKEYNLSNYLEIGCRDNECFNEINAKNKKGVDPKSGGTHRMQSDTYFKINSLPWNKKKFDIIFIDGLHYSKQVVKDISNSLKYLNKNGFIVMHDCNPQKEDEAAYPYQGSWTWNGDVWKAFVHFRQDKNLDMITGDFDHGCGIIIKRQNTDILKIKKNYNKLEWDDLVKNRKKYLRLKSFEEIKSWLNLHNM